MSPVQSYRTVNEEKRDNLSLEFINNSWFLIRWNETLDIFVTNSELEIPATDQAQIGVQIWPPNNPRHPSHIDTEVAHSPNPGAT
jgi:hypothetical protein